MAVPYLQVDNLTKSFGDLVLFENISFGIAEGQRVGLIAKNGSGKTTLLNIIAGKEGYDSGNIVFRRDLRVDYLEQDPQYPEELTVLEACFHHGNSTVELIKEYERCMETEGHPGLEDLLARMDQEKAWEYEQKAKQILSQLKIRNFDQRVKQLSARYCRGVGIPFSRRVWAKRHWLSSSAWVTSSSFLKRSTRGARPSSLSRRISRTSRESGS